jgi:EmrB/QacA subfamily drug resistance transporter
MTATLDRPLAIAAPLPASTPSVRRGIGFAAVLGATVMDLLDSTVVGVAAPAIRAELGGSYAVMQWTAAGYTLALAVLLLVGGRLGDMFGRRRMLLVGVAGFAAASLACALAWSPEVLVAGRVLQGAFGALMLPQGFGLIRDLFPPAELAKAWALFGPVMGVGAILGPVVGGVLVNADLFGTGWRMIFLVNLPIALAVLAAARHLPAAQPTAAGTRLDLPGVGLAAVGTVLLIFPLVQGHELGWPLWTFASMIAAAPVFAVFARRQVRLARAGRAPLVEPSIFTKRSYLAGVGFAVVFLAAMGALFTVGVMLQIGLGFSAIQASLTMAPWAVGALIGSAFAGTTMTRLGRFLLHLGLAMTGLGVVGLYAAYQLAGVEIGFATLAGPLLVGGAGMGMIFVPMFDIILSGVADHETGSASGALGALEQLGMTLGVAILGTVFFTVVGPVPTPETALQAGTVTALVTLGLIAVAFAIGFALPRQARAGAHG